MRYDPFVQDPRGKTRPHQEQILVVLPTWVGDFVMATPILRAIRNRFPDARITFLAEPNLRELIAGGDWMNEVIEWPPVNRRSLWHGEFRRLVGLLRRRRFDQAILLPNSFRSALTVWLGRARKRIGYARDGRHSLLTDGLVPRNCRKPGEPWDLPAHCKKGPFKPMPLVEYYADLAEFIGCNRPSDRFELFTTPECDSSVDVLLRRHGLDNAHPLVAISPGGRYGSAKCWMPERFAAVGDRLVDECQASVIVTCGPGEEPLARAVRSCMRHGALVLDNPLLSLGELKSLIRRCDLLLCNDTGPRHFAKAFGVGVVTVFGPTHPEWTATSHKDERIVRIDVDCGPCQQRVCPLQHVKCMTGVTVDMVFEACRSLLDSRGVIPSEAREKQA